MSGADQMFGTITHIGSVAGIFWFSSGQLSRRWLTLGYAVLVSMLVIMVAGFIMIFSSLWKFSQGGWTNTVLGVNFSYVVFLIMHYILHRKKIMQYFREFSILKESFFESSQHDKDYEDFKESLKKQHERLDMFIKFQFWFNFSLSPLNTLVKILTWNKLVDFNNKNYLIYAIYFEPSDNVMFWPTVSLQAASLHVLCIVQTASDLYLLQVFFLIVMSLKYLRIKLGKILSLQDDSPNVSMMNLSSQQLRKLDSNDRPVILTGMYKDYNKSLNCVPEKVKEWIEHHIYIMRLNTGFLQLYTPVLIAYFVNVLLGDCLGIFGVTQDEGNFFSLAEKILIGSYFVQNAITLSLICLAGTGVAYESTRVFEDGFHAPWHDYCDEATKSTLSVVSTVSKRALKLTPRNSTTAQLSTDTLLWMLRTMLSVYVALTQIKAAFNNN